MLAIQYGDRPVCIFFCYPFVGIGKNEVRLLRLKYHVLVVEEYNLCHQRFFSVGLHGYSASSPPYSKCKPTNPYEW